MSRSENRRPPSHPNQPQQHKQNDSHSHSTNGHHLCGKQQFAVLYTHQKTKKKKSWNDGRLQWAGGRATLYEANPIPGSGNAALDSTEVTWSQIQNLANGQGGNLESEKYLIQIEGQWTSGGAWNTKALPSDGVSEGMKKLMGKKFQVPSRKMPNFEEQKRLKWEKENKRRRVLQPGELERMYYGGGGGFGGHDDRLPGVNYGNGGSSSHDGGTGFGSNGYRNESQENFDLHDNSLPSTGRSQHYNFRHNVSQKENVGPDSGHNNNRDNNCSTQFGNANGFERIEQTSQNKVERNQDRFQNYHGVNPRSISVEVPQPFQSNEPDPSGYYEEEEEDDGEDAVRGWVGNDHGVPFEQQEMNGNHGNSSSDVRSIDYNNSQDFSSQDTKQNKYGTVNVAQAFRDNSSQSQPNEMRQEQCASYDQPKSSKISSPKVCHVTDTLNALFGATTPPDEEPSAIHAFGDKTPNVKNDRDNIGHDTSKTLWIHGNGDTNPSKPYNNSFLAGFIEAEENVDDDIPLGGLSTYEYECDSQQYDDIDDQRSQDDDLDSANITNDKKVGQAMHDVSTHKAPEEFGVAQITGLSLPSAGESSSEEEDLLSEEP